MNIQIIGTNKSADTRKAQRFFSERGIKYHFKDLSDKKQLLTKGELNNITQVIPIEELLDKESKEYTKRNMQFMVIDYEEELLNNQLLFRMPIVRNGRKVTIGYQPEIWKEWILSEKNTK